MRMFDNVQTSRVGMDMLIVGLAPLIALGLERYCQEGHEHGQSDYTARAGKGRTDCRRARSGCGPLYQRHWIRVIRRREGAITLQNRRSPMHIAGIVPSIRRREIRRVPARSLRERA